MRRAKRRPPVEVYDLKRSPFAQRPTQRDVAALLSETKGNLETLLRYKDQFIVRRSEVIGGKERQLAYPVDRLRAVHERLKFHLNKVRQPDYLFSPRKGRGQRDNAAHHLDNDQYLTLDLKQFYPSTTASMIQRWFFDELGMYRDVAGLLTQLATIDGKASFGSPLTPVLCTLVHRPMFDRIAAVCEARHLRFSLWVDDLTISGKFVPGEVVSAIRGIVRASGLRSHEVRYRSGNRPVFITGIGVVGAHLVAPNSLNLRIKEYWSAFHSAQTDDEKVACIGRLLSQLGTVRHIVGPSSDVGRKMADQMNSLRQKRDKYLRRSLEAALAPLANAPQSERSHVDIPF